MQTTKLVGDGIEEQPHQALNNRGASLAEARSGFDKVLKTTVLLMDMGDFAKVNEVYGEWLCCMQACRSWPPASCQLGSCSECAPTSAHVVRAQGSTSLRSLRRVHALR